MIRRLLGEGGLSKRVGVAGIWSILGFGTNNTIRLASNLVLTRLLSPEIFGLMALAQVFMAGITMMSDVGVAASVVRSTRGDDTKFLQTAWTVQIIRSTLIALICCLISWPVSLIYGEPVLFPLICVLSLSAFINGFRSISVQRANRKLQLKELTILAIITRVLTFVITVFFAWQLESVWALAIGACGGAFINISLTHIMLQKFDHRFYIEKEALSEIFKFGRWVLLATFFTYLGTRGQQALFSFVVPIEVIGLLSIAALLASIPNNLFNKLLNTVLLPSFSEIVRERPQDLPRALRKVRMFTIGIAFPMMFAVSFAAQFIVDIMYDDRYAAAGTILTLAAINGSIPLLSMTYQNILLAKGRSDLHAGLMFVWAASTTSGIFIGFSFLGLIGSLVGVGLAASLMVFINSAIAKREGYATAGLDIVAFMTVLCFYVFSIWSLDAPQAFTSPDLTHQIFRE